MLLPHQGPGPPPRPWGGQTPPSVHPPGVHQSLRGAGFEAIGCAPRPVPCSQPGLQGSCKAGVEGWLGETERSFLKQKPTESVVYSSLSGSLEEGG